MFYDRTMMISVAELPAALRRKAEESNGSRKIKFGKNKQKIGNKNLPNIKTRVIRNLDRSLCESRIG